MVKQYKIIHYLLFGYIVAQQLSSFVFYLLQSSQVCSLVCIGMYLSCSNCELSKLNSSSALLSLSCVTISKINFF